MTFPRLFHDQFKFSMTQKCWKPSLLGAYFCSVTRRIFQVFKQHRIFGPKKWNSMTFPWPQPFSLKSMTFPGLENAFSNSMTFHDFSWPYEPCCLLSYYRPISGLPNAVLNTSKWLLSIAVTVIERLFTVNTKAFVLTITECLFIQNKFL